jgi:hypothetical protein
VYFVDLFVVMLLILVFCGGCVFFWVFSKAVKHQARAYQMATAGTRGREQKKIDDSEMLDFMDELADAWAKKPPEHKPLEFMMKDGGGLICLRHGPLIMKHAGKLTKMITKRLGVGNEEAGSLIKGFLGGPDE